MHCPGSRDVVHVVPFSPVILFSGVQFSCFWKLFSKGFCFFLNFQNHATRCLIALGICFMWFLVPTWNWFSIFLAIILVPIYLFTLSTHRRKRVSNLQFCSFLFPVSGPWFPVSRFWILISSFRLPVSDFRFLLSAGKFVSNFKVPVSDFWLPAVSVG